MFFSIPYYSTLPSFEGRGLLPNTGCGRHGRMAFCFPGLGVKGLRFRAYGIRGSGLRFSAKSSGCRIWDVGFRAKTFFLGGAGVYSQVTSASFGGLRREGLIKFF